MSKKHLVILSGAGISAESGLQTFRDSGGLWEGWDPMKVATPEAWEANPHEVLHFYNLRRKGVAEAKPNAGHHACKELEGYFDVDIITQNIDNLHERAGSSRVMHLHGNIFKARSTQDENLVYDLDRTELNWGDQCEKGSQLRPHIVWFGEAVPMIEPAAQLMETADIVVVVGTSLQVYPAAGLLNYAPRHAHIYVVDPGAPEIAGTSRVTYLAEPATTGMKKLVEMLKPLAGE